MTDRLGGAAFFSRPRNVVLLATLCCLLWGSAYPAIKSGYALLAIGRDDTASQLVFAGWRFLLAGVLLLGIARAIGRPVFASPRASIGRIALLGLAQTSLQYVFFYVGLAHTTASRRPSSTPPAPSSACSWRTSSTTTTGWTTARHWAVWWASRA